MDDNYIQELLENLDGSGSDKEFQAVAKLKVLGDLLPSYLLGKYRQAKNWKHRASCVYHALKYAQKSKDAFLLGIEGVMDKSQVVRYRACMLLAYSQKKEALSALRKALEKFNQHKITRGDILAAIDAIESNNHHYFVDRDHSGMMTLSINED